MLKQMKKEMLHAWSLGFNGKLAVCLIFGPAFGLSISMVLFILI